MPEVFTPTGDWLCRHVVEHSHVEVIYGDAARFRAAMEQGVAEQRREATAAET